MSNDNAYREFREAYSDVLADGIWTCRGSPD